MEREPLALSESDFVLETVDRGAPSEIAGPYWRNPMINTKLSGRYNSYIRAVDELPEMLFVTVLNKKSLYFDPLPPLESEPADERSRRFQRALSTALNSDEEYLEDVEEAEEDTNGDESEDFETLRAVAERRLRDRLRESLVYSSSNRRKPLLTQHAKNHDIKPPSSCRS